MRVRLSRAAGLDLRHLHKHISKDNPPAANRMAAAIVASIDRLSEHPRIGHAGALPGTFEIVVRPYVVVYEITPQEIVVVRIWHGAQRRPGT